MGNLPGRFQRLFQGGRRTVHALLRKSDIAQGFLQARFIEQPLRLIIHHRGVMLVYTGKEHPFTGRARRLRQGVAPMVIGVVADLAPVHRHKYQWFVRAQQRRPMDVKGIHHLRRGRNAAAHARMAQGDGNVFTECSQLIRSG
ncbi:MAG: hypothetical protein BWX80_02639 [Candidatus Hydrogenedentes bacterium ADurb.Bin101]|nr:MAG: hypothetical protein BWX80_02639 [Candidatus Hydrogenedentes bacterium ADurb.Bin101]